MNTNQPHTMNTTIITHFGQAHRDEFLACCILAASLAPHGDITIYRRNPTKEDLDDAQIFVVDTGRDWNWQFRNFDHHQFPRHSEPCCALTLVLKYLGLEDDFREHWGSLKATEVVDSKGPAQRAADLGIEVEQFMKTMSPVEQTMLQIFGTRETIHIGERFDALGTVMQEIGRSMIEQVRMKKNRLPWLIDNHAVLHIDADHSVIYVPRGGEADIQPALGMSALKQHVEEQLEGRTVVASICPDDRGGGYTLYRYNEHPSLDFSVLEGREGIGFVHSNGFIAKTEGPMDIEKMMGMIRDSWELPTPAMAKGFTLLELLIAIVVFGAIVTGLFLLF